MKNHILLSLFILLLSCSNIKKSKNNSENINFAATQENYKCDTVAYIKENFIQNKEKYIGKNIGILLNDLELPILKYNLGLDENLKDFYFISFRFFNDITIENRKEKKKDPLIINIFLDKPVDINFPLSLSRKNKQQWMQDEADFWDKQKIKDIGIVDYGF